MKVRLPHISSNPADEGCLPLDFSFLWRALRPQSLQLYNLDTVVHFFPLYIFSAVLDDRQLLQDQRRLCEKIDVLIEGPRWNLKTQLQHKSSP